MSSKSYEGDHIYKNQSDINVILYGTPGSKIFSTHHNELKRLSNENRISYVLRLIHSGELTNRIYLYRNNKGELIYS